MTQNATEAMIYRTGDVTVTTKRFVVGAQTYAVRNITSVRIEPPAPIVRPIGAIFFALGVVVAVGGLTSGNGASGGITIMAIPAFFVLLRYLTAEYALVLTTSAGEARALGSKQLARLQVIAGSLDQAICSQ